jgi:phosphoribosylglycinamide formyltransferase-1
MRIALLISGRGSTAEAIINACKTGKLKGVTPACVISSRELSPKHFSSSEEFGKAILKICADNKVDFIGQYGWLVKTPKNVIEAYQDMMVNQHNGPLPEFGGDGMYGMRVHCARLLFARRVQRDFWTEGVAQRVAVEFDGGAVLKAGRAPILENDTPETLAARLLPVEHEVQIAMLRDFVNGTVKEITRPEPLMRPGEEAILAECKKEAIMRYPKG